MTVKRSRTVLAGGQAMCRWKRQRARAYLPLLLLRTADPRPTLGYAAVRGPGAHLEEVPTGQQVGTPTKS